MTTRQSLQPSLDLGDYAFVHRLRTRFHETDAMGVIHHGAYLTYLEEARVEYLKAIGHPYQGIRSGAEAGVTGAAEGDGSGADGVGQGHDFAVLEVSVRYRQPLHFDDEVDVALVVGNVTRATFQIAYLLSVAGDPHATAVTVHGCVDRRGRPARLPEWVRHGLAR